MKKTSIRVMGVFFCYFLLYLTVYVVTQRHVRYKGDYVMNRLLLSGWTFYSALCLYGKFQQHDHIANGGFSFSAAS